MILNLMTHEVKNVIVRIRVRFSDRIGSEFELLLELGFRLSLGLVLVSIYGVIYPLAGYLPLGMSDMEWSILPVGHFSL